MRFYVYDRWAHPRDGTLATWEVWDRGSWGGYRNRKLVRVFKSKDAADRHCEQCNEDWERYSAAMRRSS